MLTQRYYALLKYYTTLLKIDSLERNTLASSLSRQREHVLVLVLVSSTDCHALRGVTVRERERDYDDAHESENGPYLNYKVSIN